MQNRKLIWEIENSSYYKMAFYTLIGLIIIGGLGFVAPVFLFIINQKVTFFVGVFGSGITFAIVLVYYGAFKLIVLSLSEIITQTRKS